MFDAYLLSDYVCGDGVSIPIENGIKKQEDGYFLYNEDFNDKTVTVMIVDSHVELLFEAILPHLKRITVPQAACVNEESTKKVYVNTADRICLQSRISVQNVHISTVSEAAALLKEGGVALFDKLELLEKKFIVLGQVKSGCPSPPCWLKSCKNLGDGVFRCRRCGGKTQSPMESVVVKFEIGNEESSIEVAVFNQDLVEMLHLTISQLKKITEEDSNLDSIVDRLKTKDQVFIIRPNVWRPDNSAAQAQFHAVQLRE